MHDFISTDSMESSSSPAWSRQAEVELFSFQERLYTPQEVADRFRGDLEGRTTAREHFRASFIRVSSPRQPEGFTGAHVAERGDSHEFA